MQSLLADPSIVGGQASEIKAVVSSELNFLDKRTDFWRQQKPIYARSHEQKLKATIRPAQATQPKSKFDLVFGIFVMRRNVVHRAAAKPVADQKELEEKLTRSIHQSEEGL